jgi:hypothetical protein
MNTFTIRRESYSLGDMREELWDLARAQHDSRAYRRLFSVPLSVARVREHHLQKAIWVLNRRDCWAYAQAKSPFGVKQLIWEHESEELHGGGERNVDNHYALSVKEGEALGLTPEDFAKATPTDTVLTCMKAWVQLVKDEHWLKSFAACAALELTNADDIVGEGASHKMALRIRDQLGIGMEKQQSLQEHMQADVEHATIMMTVAKRHADTDRKRRKMVDGAKESWAIDRVFREHLADLMESIPE